MRSSPNEGQSRRQWGNKSTVTLRGTRLGRKTDPLNTSPALAAAGAEEVAQQGGAIVGEDAVADLGPPVTGRLVEIARPVQDRAALGIAGSENQPSDAGMADGSGAHGTRFKRHIEPKAGQAIIAQGGPGSA